MNNKICIIAVYFGRLPHNFSLWEKSCEYNPEIDFILFTDQIVSSNVKNLMIYHLTLHELSTNIEKKLDMSIALKFPAKCCDFKPAYGVIFEEYLTNYDFWGYSDIDLVFGDIKYFLIQYNYVDYDKFLPLGHLTLYRNTKENNYRFKLPCSTENYITAFSTNDNIIFDERSIPNIYREYNFPTFTKRIFADISPRNKRFTLSGNDINYKYQVFSWENGHVYRYYIVDNIINKEEYIYIHFQKRKMIIDSIDSNSFWITPLGFKRKTDDDVLKAIVKYNKYRGEVYEKMERVLAKIERKKRNMEKRMKRLYE